MRSTSRAALLSAACGIAAGLSGCEEPVGPGEHEVIRPPLEVLGTYVPPSVDGVLMIYGQLSAGEPEIHVDDAVPVRIETSGGDAESLELRREFCGERVSCYMVEIDLGDGLEVTDPDFLEPIAPLGGILISVADQGHHGVVSTKFPAVLAAQFMRRWPHVERIEPARYFSVAEWVRIEHAITGAIHVEEEAARPEDSIVQVPGGGSIFISYSDRLGREITRTITR